MLYGLTFLSLGLPRRHEAINWLDVSYNTRAFPQPSLIIKNSFKTDRVAGENKDFTGWIDRYLGVGEWVMDQSVAIAGSSGYFERTR